MKGRDLAKRRRSGAEATVVVYLADQGRLMPCITAAGSLAGCLGRDAVVWGRGPAERCARALCLLFSALGSCDASAGAQISWCRGLGTRVAEEKRALERGK